jgi:hypothetical protein
MALNKNRLEDDLLALMNSAKDEEWTTEQVAAELAQAIDRYVSDADVVDVEVKVGDTEYDQSNKGGLE